MKVKHAVNIEASFQMAKKYDSLEQSIKKAELLLAAFVVEHNLPFLIMEHLPKLLKSIDPTSQVIQKINASRTKITKLVTTLGDVQQENLAKILNNCKFAIIVDETTDISTEKCLAILVRYVDRQKLKIEDKLLTFVNVTNSTATGIATEIIETLGLLKINIKNLIGFGADNAAVMMGNEGGVRAKLQTYVPEIFVLGCVCHSIALCASYAAEKLPGWLEEFIRDVYNYIYNSSKKLHKFIEIQDMLNLKPHKLIKLAQTRWLCLEVKL